MNNKLAGHSVTSLNIDIFRTFLAQWVILGHVASVLLPIPMVPGRLAVWCFFVVSGYLNALSFQNRFATGNWLHTISGYYVSRIKRIYPLLIVSYLMVSILLGTMFNADLWTLIPVQHQVQKLQLSNSVLWTLMIEIQLYFFTPFLFLVASRVKRWHWLLLVAICLALVFQVPKLQMSLLHDSSLIDNRTVTGNLGFYLFGMLLALGRDRVMSIPVRLESLLWSAWVVWIIYFLYRYNFHAPGVQFDWGQYVAIFTSLLVLISVSPLFARGHSVFGFLGYYTYEIYVLHGLFVFLYHRAELSGKLSALFFWWALPLVMVVIMDVIWKKKYLTLMSVSNPR